MKQGKNLVNTGRLKMINYEPDEVDYDEELIYEGATVWFTDPDNEISSGLYTVERINGEVYSLSNGVEAYEHELEVRYDEMA